MHMGAGIFQRAVDSSRPVLATVTVSQFDEPTPCASWRVRDLINHMVDAATFAATVMETGSFTGAPDGGTDHAAGDFLAAYDRATARAAAGFAAPGALDTTVTLPFADLPASVFLQIASGDAFVHGWDLAKATGQSTDLDPELAAELLAGVTALLPDEFRGPDGQAPFGPKVAVPVDAPVVDQLVGFLGRTP